MTRSADHTVPTITMAPTDDAESTGTRVFEGPYRKVGEWSREMEEYVRGHGERVENLYYFYATCPRCAKHYGKNQVVLFARVEAEAA